MAERTHDEMRELTGAYALGALDDRERRLFEAHLETCAECDAEVRSFGPVIERLAISVPPAEAPRALRDGVMAAIHGTQGARPHRVARWVPWLASAAVLLLAVFTWYALTLRSRAARLEAELRSAQSRLTASERIAYATDMRRIDLVGEGSAPAASGHALWSPRQGMMVTAVNLPPAPAGKAYQLWFLTGPGPVSGGTLVAIGGVFEAITAPPTGGARVMAIAVTLESAEGARAPTTPICLLGKL